MESNNFAVSNALSCMIVFKSLERADFVRIHNLIAKRQFVLEYNLILCMQFTYYNINKNVTNSKQIGQHQGTNYRLIGNKQGTN